MAQCFRLGMFLFLSTFFCSATFGLDVSWASITWLLMSLEKQFSLFESVLLYFYYIFIIFKLFIKILPEMIMKIIICQILN